jgi:hypothetical protein
MRHGKRPVAEDAIIYLALLALDDWGQSSRQTDCPCRDRHRREAVDNTDGDDGDLSVKYVTVHPCQRRRHDRPDRHCC